MTFLPGFGRTELSRDLTERDEGSPDLVSGQLQRQQRADDSIARIEPGAPDKIWLFLGNSEGR